MKTGRPVTPAHLRRVEVGLRLPQWKADELERLAIENGTPKSRLIEEALRKQFGIGKKEPK